MSCLRTASKTAPAAASRLREYHCACQECGASFSASQASARFCSRDCRNAFDNRRKARGAILYDLFMANNYERKIARPLGIWSKMFRAASHWKAEDEAQREGRASWPDLQTTLQKTPHLFSSVIVKRKPKP